MMKTFIFIAFLHASCSLRFSLRSTAPDLTAVTNATNLEKKKGYPSRNIIDPNSLSINTADDACSSDIIVQTLNFGFGCKVNSFMNQILLAAYGHHTVALSGRHPFMKQWKAHFKDTLPYCDSKITQTASASGGFFKGLSKVDPKFATDMKRAVYKKIYQLKDDSQNRVEETLKKLGFSEEVKMIGVHMRRGDKIKESPPIDDETYANEIQQSSTIGDLYKESDHIWSKQDLELYYSKKAQLVKLEADKHPDVKTVYLASDDVLARDALKRILGDTYNIIGTSAQAWDEGENKQMYSDTDILFNLLTDVEALKRSEVFLGTGSSNLGRTVYFLRDENKKSVSLDEDWLTRPM